MIGLYREDPPITSLGLGKLSCLMMFESQPQHASGSGINRLIA